VRSDVAGISNAAADNFYATDLKFTATAADTIAPMTCAASATFAKPTYTGTAAVTIGHMTCAASDTFTKPTYTAAVAVSSAPMTCSAQAQHYFAHPVGKLTRPMLGIFTRRYKSFAGKLAYSATAAAAIGAMLCSGSAAFAKPTYTGTAADSAAPMTCQAFATQTLPTIFSASVSVTVAPVICSASATFDATVNLGDSDICLDLQRCPRVLDLQRRPIVLDLGDR
jgi:hypothetical protein